MTWKKWITDINENSKACRKFKNGIDLEQSNNSMRNMSVE